MIKTAISNLCCIVLITCLPFCNSYLYAQESGFGQSQNLWGGIPQAIVVRTTENLANGRWRWIVDKAHELKISRIDVLVKQDENNYSSKSTGQILKSGELLVKLPGEITVQGWNNSTWLHDMLAYGKQLGVQIWAWWPTFQDATMAKEFPRHVYRSSEGEIFVDACVQGVQQRQEILLTKLIDSYALDGIALDWLRCNSIEEGRSGPLAKDFQTIVSMPWSAELLNQPMMSALWYRLRSTVISDWVQEFITRSRRGNPSVSWSAFVLPWQFKEVAQDYRSLAQSGLNYLQPMVYWNDWGESALWTGPVLSGHPFWFRGNNSRFAMPKWDTHNIDRIAVTRADELIPLSLPKDAHTERLWWLAFLEVARKTASVDLMEGTLKQLDVESASHPQVILTRAAIDFLKGFSVQGRAKIEKLLSANDSNVELRNSVSSLLEQYDPLM